MAADRQAFETTVVPKLNEKAQAIYKPLHIIYKKAIIKWFNDPESIDTGLDIESMNIILKDELIRVKNMKGNGGSRRRRRSIPKSSRKFKKSSKRVFRKKSRSTRRR